MAESTRTAFIRLEQVTRTYGDTVAVDNLDLQVFPGETLGLLGRNGAGKTSTIEMVVGLARPCEGSVMISGSEFDQATGAGYDRVGYVPQSISLYPLLSVRENVELMARLRNQTLDGVAETIERLALTALGSRRASELSGGEQRRVQLAMALVHEPDVLVLDEPTANVDVSNRRLIVELIESLKNDGTTIFYTTHYLEEAEQLCDRIAVLDRGRLRLTGTTSDVIRTHGIGALVLGLNGSDLAIDSLVDALSLLERVDHVRRQDDTVVLSCQEPQAVLLEALPTTSCLDVEVTRLEVVPPRLEGVFMKLTGERAGESYE